MSAPQPDTAGAVAFLKTLRPEGPWAISALHPDAGGMTTRTFLQEAALCEFIDANNGVKNLYYALNPTPPGLHKKAAKTDVTSVVALHVDIDARAGEPLEDEIERIRCLAPDGVPPPTYIVMTGGGFQFIWILDKPIDGDWEHVELFNKELERVYGGDHCHDVSRILRLPGTVNLPDFKKRKRGRVPVLAVLTAHHADRVYSITRFNHATAPGVAREGGAVRVADLDRWNLPPLALTIIINGKDPKKPDRFKSRSEALFYVCCALVRAGAPDDVILDVITDPDLAISEHTIQEETKNKGYARRQVKRAKETVARDPLVLNKESPLLSADWFKVRTRPTLMHYNDDFLAYGRASYLEIENATIKSELYKFLNSALTPGKEGEVPFNPTNKKVGDVLDALRAVTHVPFDTYAPPCWLEGDGPPPAELLACRNGLLHLPTGELLEPTPRFFTRNALDFDHDPSAPAPAAWLRFLRDLWGDGDEIGLLQEIMGYLLVPDTSQQKIFLLVGPRRSGKGTIGRVLKGLVGRHNTCGPSLGTLARDFGLASLIGKQLAIVSDMRLGKMTDRAALTENLLRISGEDVITADRKYKTAWTGQLAVRFLILTNQLPNLPDDSGALASRMVPLVLRESFYGREKLGLAGELLADLPGILLWAVAGWRRLQKRGHFVLPEASLDTMEDIHTMGSPAAAFLRERCVLDHGAVTPKGEVWRAWREWCGGRGMYVGDKGQFGMRLLTAGQGRVFHTKLRRGDARVPSYRGLKLRDVDRPETGDAQEEKVLDGDSGTSEVPF